LLNGLDRDRFIASAAIGSFSALPAFAATVLRLLRTQAKRLTCQMWEETSNVLITLECLATRGGRTDAWQAHLKTLMLNLRVSSTAT
jgi:hypothetical protein